VTPADRRLPEHALRAPALDHSALDLDAAERVTYVIEQSFRYDYTAPVERLRHRLVVLPPRRHGNQVLRARRLEVTGAATQRVTRRDARGNTVVRLRAERVEVSVRFAIGALLERVRADGPVRLPGAALTDPRLLRPTRLTAPDAAIRELAWELGRHGGTPVELAARICAAVHTALGYAEGSTSVATTAAQALAGGRGVCQDSAHLMLAVCHVLGLPARYVSGHLLGQGGTHAWVEVVVPHADHAVALPYDPCNGVTAGARYLTVATGRDYADVPPTSGTYVGPPTGRLTADRRVAVVSAS
jgi:transglutaminase-like putative cysteine protease